MQNFGSRASENFLTSQALQKLTFVFSEPVSLLDDHMGHFLEGFRVVVAWGWGTVWKSKTLLVRYITKVGSLFIATKDGSFSFFALPNSRAQFKFHTTRGTSLSRWFWDDPGVTIRAGSGTSGTRVFPWPNHYSGSKSAPGYPVPYRVSCLDTAH